MLAPESPSSGSAGPGAASRPVAGSVGRDGGGHTTVPGAASVPGDAAVAAPAGTRATPDLTVGARLAAAMTRLVRPLAIATAVATYLLILIGGLVHGTGSSLACPDWPTCYGSFMPKMEGGVAVEHSHRLAAASVVVLTLGLALATSLSRAAAHRPLRRLAWLAVTLVIVQAVLGGITVKLRLPTLVSTLHLATSQLFFITVLYTALRAPSRAVLGAQAPLARTPLRLAVTPDLAAARAAALVAAVVVYFQMVLGGLVRHSGAALACLDIPLCRGSLWPEAHPTVLVQALHRLGASAVTLAIAVSAVLGFRATRGRGALRALVLAAPVLVLAQVALGLYAVVSFLDLATVEAHLGVASALLASQLGLSVAFGKLAAVPAARVAGNASRAAQPDVRAVAASTAGTRGWSATVVDLVRLAKPRITGLVLATFGGGMWLAPGTIGRSRAILTLLGTALIVGASNALNMLIEREADARMERTRNRPLPEGRLSPATALVFGTALAAAALPLLMLAGNALTGILGGLAFVTYVAVYTPMKRSSASALFVGAIPGALPPLMGWTAVTGHIDAGALALFGVLFLWQIPHFLAIALYRFDDYQRAGFEVLPVSIGPDKSRALIAPFSIALVAVSLVLGPLHVAGAVYSAAAIVLGASFVLLGLRGARRAAGPRWARSVFLGSLAYLTLLFVALVIDHLVA